MLMMLVQLRKSALVLATLWLASSFIAAHSQQAPAKIANLVYGPSNQVLDLFVPANAPKHTALLFIHGGGFKQGSKDDMALYAYLYAQGGFVAATMNYRLSSQVGYAFPMPLDDVRDAIKWMKA